MNPLRQTINRDHVSVCICTFNRPELLANLLRSLARQTTDDLFTYEVVVVDNDAKRSAEGVVRAASAGATIGLTYDCEPERNISLTRNRAIRNATGNLVAFIDDDETPVDDWLVRLYRTLKLHQVHGVLGPVLPEFPPGAPAWLHKARVFERRRHRTGTAISSSDARTGNVLLDRAMFSDDQAWFDPAFGRTGGEDSDFFARQFRLGRRFVWCDEATASETVPPERWTVSFHIRRLWRAGVLDGEWMRTGKVPGGLIVAKNAVLLGGLAVVALPSIVLPKHIHVRIAQKLAYCAGVVSAYAGVSLLRERE